MNSNKQANGIVWSLQVFWFSLAMTIERLSNLNNVFKSQFCGNQRYQRRIYLRFFPQTVLVQWKQHPYRWAPEYDLQVDYWQTLWPHLLGNRVRALRRSDHSCLRSHALLRSVSLSLVSLSLMSFLFLFPFTLGHLIHYQKSLSRAAHVCWVVRKHGVNISAGY